ncbi:MAG: lamin tail domain-containing protein [Pirellulales bacterium]
MNAQLEITEVMHTPLGNASLWEWVEVRNTSTSAIDLDGWIFDDDDDVPVSELNYVNIKATNGNTVIPAGGVAVLYAGSDLNYTPSRFTNAWGSGVTLIPVTNFTTLTATDAIGLWPNRTAYLADDLGEGENPRRSFNHAAAWLDYQLEFPQAAAGHSIAYKGTGDYRDAGNWVQSRTGMLQASTSVATTLAGTALNGEDRGNPGLVPGGSTPTGLLITEVMAAPDSPEPAWEWVEVLNNTGTTINFSAQNYVLHDDDGADFSNANITSGVLPQGGVGVLFNAAANSLANMQAAWGSGINFIPVSAWGNGLANGGDTIALWDSIDDYDRDKPGSGRTTDHAVSVVTYAATDPWPTSDNASSIYLRNLGFDPADGDNWRLSDDDDFIGSFVADPVLGTLVDHPGGDVGSPGKVGAAAVGGVLGDYSGNNRVDAADYTIWRDRLNGNSLTNDASPGSVTLDDYNYWKSRFGATTGAGAVATVPEPACMTTVVSFLFLSAGARSALPRNRWISSLPRIGRC